MVNLDKAFICFPETTSSEGGLEMTGMETQRVMQPFIITRLLSPFEGQQEKLRVTPSSTGEENQEDVFPGVKTSKIFPKE